MNIFQKALFQLKLSYHTRSLRPLSASLARRFGREDELETSYLSLYFDSAPPGVFVDVGSNDGLWAKRMARSRQVYAFDPEPAVSKILDGVPNVTFFQTALSDANGSATLHRAWLPAQSSLTDGVSHPKDTVEVHVATLDSFGLENVGLIKIDTEGMERKVIDGARKTITRDRPRLIVEAHGEGDCEPAVKEIGSSLQSLGYSWKIVHRRASGQPHLVADPGTEVGLRVATK